MFSGRLRRQCSFRSRMAGCARTVSATARLDGVTDVLDFQIGLWFSAISATVACYLTLRASLVGLIEYRFSRMITSVAVGFIALSYWWEIFVDDGTGPLMRRGAGWLLWPSLSWTAAVVLRQTASIRGRIEGP